MLSASALKRFKLSLIKLARESDEMRREVEDFKRSPGGIFLKTIEFSFGKFGVTVKFVGHSPEDCKGYCKIIDNQTAASF